MDQTTTQIETTEGNIIGVETSQKLTVGAKLDLFIRPEAMLIQPDIQLKKLNRFLVNLYYSSRKSEEV